MMMLIPFSLMFWMKSEHYQGPETVCQQAEIGMFLGDVTEGNMVS